MAEIEELPSFYVDNGNSDYEVKEEARKPTPKSRGSLASTSQLKGSKSGWEVPPDPTHTNASQSQGGLLVEQVTHSPSPVPSAIALDSVVERVLR